MATSDAESSQREKGVLVIQDAFYIYMVVNICRPFIMQNVLKEYPADFSRERFIENIKTY